MHAIRHEVWIGAEPSKVFDAITTREGLDGWWGKAVAAEARLDSVVELDHGLGQPLRMRIIELTLGRSLTWRCLSEFRNPGMPGSEWLGHRLTFELQAGSDELDSAWLRERLRLAASGGLTILQFTHTGWTPDARWLAFCNTSWGVTLDGLKRHCEATSEDAQR
jgi:uncharacterized protein YndB with AHSA1/START domain